MVSANMQLRTPHTYTHIHIHSTVRISGKHVKRLKIDAETTNASK